FHHTDAATSTGTVLTTSPVAIDLKADPGTQTSTNLQVQNNSTKTLTIKVKLKEFKANGDSGQAQIFDPPANDPSIAWVTFSRTEFSADPGVWNSVKMTINLPSTAAYGYYYAVEFVPQSTVQTSRNKVKGANAIFVLLNAHTNDEKNTLVVKSFSADKSLYQYLPANFSLKVNNAGNIYTAPEGTIFISRSLHGSPIATLDINPGAGNVLPDTNRVFHASWNDGFPVYQYKRIDGQVVSGKDGKPVQTLHWSGNVSKFRFGKYYARLVLVYKNGAQDVPVNAEVSFWVIPWFMILILVVILILVGFGIWALLKDSKKVYRWFGKK
ncbi:MAG TPA: hypothetical protein VLG47_03800, partial [Candidatus Saccharimonadales bacterium]|nr:hypothetical protein [Candidatus Saccharimonadales bacterium]